MEVFEDDGTRKIHSWGWFFFVTPEYLALRRAARSAFAEAVVETVVVDDKGWPGSDDESRLGKGGKAGRGCSCTCGALCATS